MSERCSCCSRELREFPLLSYEEIKSLKWETIREDRSVAIRSLIVSLHSCTVHDSSYTPVVMPQTPPTQGMIGELISTPSVSMRLVTSSNPHIIPTIVTRVGRGFAPSVGLHDSCTHMYMQYRRQCRLYMRYNWFTNIANHNIRTYQTSQPRRDTIYPPSLPQVGGNGAYPLMG